MDKSLDLSRILIKWGHKLKLNQHNEYMRFLSYDVEHHNIVSITILLRDDTSIVINIRGKPLSIELYKNHGYQLCPDGISIDIMWLSKSFQSFEDLLDELRDLGLINCGHNIKRTH